MLGRDRKACGTKWSVSRSPALCRKTLTATRNRSRKCWRQLGKQIEKLDPTLKGTVERARKRIEFHIDKLRRKTGRGTGPEAGLISGHERYLESLLYPHKGPARAGIVSAAVSGAMGGWRAQRITKACDRQENRASLHHSTSVGSGVAETIRIPLYGRS